MRISCVGWHGKHNIGDDCFRIVLSDFFAGHEVEFVTPPNQCSNPDIVVLGGGAVASPFYLNVLPNCPRYALGIDLAYESEADLLVQANFREIFVRTQTDAAALKNKVRCPVGAIPDLAFFIDETSRPPKQKRIGVFATDYVLPAIDRPYLTFASKAMSFVLGLSKELDQLANDGHEIVLFPCSTGGYGNDLRVNLDIAAHMQKPPTIVMEALSPQQMIATMKELELAVCMRFHAHVFAVMAAVPFVSIEYTRKVKMFLQEHGMLHLTAATSNDNFFDWSQFRIVSQRQQPTESYAEITKRHQKTLLGLKQQVRSTWCQESL
jgi:polysaccharide pyruvyl transferase WcaK-like protein